MNPSFSNSSIKDVLRFELLLYTYTVGSKSLRIRLLECLKILKPKK